MVAIVTGEGVGLERSSAWVLGSRGQLGAAGLGRDNWGVYVNAATGNLVISRQDEFLIGKGPDLSIARTYNSQAVLSDGDNNDKWQAGAYRKVVGTNGAATITRIDWDGSDTVYQMVGAGLYRTTDGGGAYDTLAWSGSQWTWTDGNSRVTDVYDSTGKLLSTSDTDGNSLAYAYDVPTGLLTRVTTSNGEYTDFAYYAGTTRLEKLTTQADSQLTRVFYEYDTDGRLSVVKVNIDPGDNSKTTGANYTTTYAYDGSSKRVASITQQDGTLLEIAYTLIGSDYRVTTLTQTVSAGVTRVTGFFYDTTNRATTITDPLGGVTRMTYDAKGNLVELVLPVPVPGAAAPTTSFVYNANGDVESMTENGRTTAYTYDANGNMTLSRDAAGNTVKRLYGANNQLLTETRYAGPDPDGAGAEPATGPMTARYAYDIENHLRFAVSAEGEVTEYRYDAPGQLTSTIAYPADFEDVAGLAWDAVLDETAMVNWANGIGDKSNVRRTDMTYDTRGNVRTVTRYSAADSLGNGLLSSAYSRDTYVYNQAGQLIDRYNNASAAIEHFVYDGLGRLISSTDMATNTTTFAFNDAASTTTVTLANGLTSASVYNRAGERISVTQSGADIATAVTTEQYDGLGRLRKTTDPTGRSTYFLYDNASRKVADVTADGAITEYGYDSSHRLVKTIAYFNKLDANQIASLSSFTAGGAGGANAGGGGAAGPVGSTLLVNGSFDTPGTGGSTLAHGLSSTSLTGWTKANGQNFEQVLAGQFSVTGTDGAYWLDLDSVPGSGQTLPTGPNLLTNGSFDTIGTGGSGLSHPSLLGWNRVNAENFDQIAAGTLGITGTDGAYWLDLDSVPGSGVILPIGANLVVNGGFEQSGVYVALPHGRSNTTLPGWTRINGETFEQVISGQFGVSASEGTYWLDLDSIPVTGYFTVGSNLLVNGSFDQSGTYTALPHGRLNTNLPGWTKTNSEQFEQVLSGQFGVTGSDGAYWLDLDSYVITATRVAVGANMLTNGSFENANGGIKIDGGWSSNTIPGWIKVGQARFERLGSVAGVQPSDGSFWLDLDGTYSTWYGGPPPEIQSPYTPVNWIENGSFEYYASAHTNQGYGVSSSSLPAWTVHGGAPLDHVFSGQFGVEATDGGFWLDLDGPAGAASNLEISQTIAGMTAGHAFLLQFDHANRTTSESGSFEVYWNEVLVATISDSSSVMQTETIQVITAAGNNVLRFRATGTEDQAGASLDNVTLMWAPPPSGGGGGGGKGGGGGGYSVWTHQNMDVSQTVSGLTAGQIVEIRFDHANRTTAASGSFEVWWNDQLVASIDQTNTTMQTKSYQIAAVTGDNVLRFKGTGTEDNIGASIDKVGIYATEPVIAGGNMDISQTIGGRTAGELLELKFDHANRTTGASGSFEVWWNGSLIETITATGTAMQTTTRTVIAVAGDNTLRFKGLGPADVAGASIDNVRLLATQPVPTGGNMDISQVIPGLTAGQTMLLEFDHANRTTGASGSFEVWWNDMLVATIDDTGTSMQSEEFHITAAGGNNTLRFKGTGTRDAIGASIDNVRLRATYVDVGGGNMDINQTVTLTAGETVQLQFNHANRTTAASGGFEVYWNGTLIDTITNSTMEMQTKTYTRTAIAGTNTLRFKGIGTVDAVGASIDNVRLYRTFVDVGGGNMDISQAVPNLTAGQSLQLQFNHANRTSTASGGFEVWWNTIKLATITNSTMAMQPELYNVTAQAGTNTVRFVGIGTVDAVGASIDNVRLFAIQGAPTPPTPAPVTDALAGMRPLASPTKDAWTWRVYDNADRLIETIDATGAATVFAYDGDSRVLSSRSYANAIAAATITGFKTTTPTAVVTPNANPVTDRLTRSFYDNDGRVVATLDGAGGLTRFEYDEAGFKVRELGAAKAAASNLWPSGTLAELIASVGTSASDRRSDFVYDGRGLLRFEIDATAKPVEYVYDANDNVIRTVGYAGSIAPAASYSLAYVTAQLTSTGLASNPANRISRTVYDAAGRAAFAIDATNAVSAFAYDNVGNLIKQTAYATPYNVPGDQSVATMQSWASGQAGNGANRITRNVYDLAGRLAYGVDAEGYVTEHQYDTAGRVTKNIRYAAQYPVVDGVTKLSLAGQIGALPADAVSVVYGYDAAGRLTDVTRDVAVGVTNVTHYVLDGLGQATDTIVAYNSATDTTTTRRVFDAAGRVTSETRGFGTTEAATTLFDYDRLGNLLTVTDARNNLTTRDYDSLGRMVKQTVQIDGNAANNLVTAYEYDAFGNLVRINDPRLNNSFLYYDSLGRAWLNVDAEGYATKTVYTAFSQPETITRYWTRPTGTPAVNAPPAIVTNAKDATTRFDYDRLGRITKTTDAESYYEQYTLNAFGDREQVRNKIDGIVINTFDRRGQLKSETLPMAAQDMWGNVTATSVVNRFDYDARGNRIRTTEADGLAEKRVTNFVYDKAGRLIEKYGESVRKSQHAEFGVPSTKYKYDLRGNLIETTDPNNQRTLSYYDALGRKTAEINAVGTMSTFGLDRNGNVEWTRVYATAVALPATAGGVPPGPPAGEYRQSSFVYDGANRLKESTLVNVRSGAWNGSAYSHSAANLTTRFDYDANGNVIKRTAANDAVTYFYYDKLNRKTAVVDAELFLSTWELDAEGNALSERRYATAAASAAIGAPPSVATNVADRLTTFVYDRNGRRVSESRHGVEAYTVSAVNGQLTLASSVSTIGYQYNGIGEVTRKTEATGEYTDYVYDAVGRLTKETRPALKEFGSSDWSWPTTDYAYSGINNLVMTRQGKEVLRASDRYTRYEYDIGGRLTKTTDAALNTREHFYDLAGNLVAQKWTRTGSTYGVEGVGYIYDAVGRVTEQRMYDVNGSTWNATPNYTMTAYNAYGEVSGKALNRPIASAQERFVYDAAGRLAGTNSGDGVWRYFVYDSVGNQTLAIESEGADLTNQAVDTVLSTAANAIAGGFTDGINVTITVFDKRGLVKETRAPQRELKIGDPRVTLITARGSNAFGDIAWERDARNNTTNYEYNTMGRTTRVIRPQVLAVDVHGAQSTVSPAERMFYDSSGRLVGSETPNGGRTSRALIGGSGYGGSEALTGWEYHDDGILKNGYDVFGDLRGVTNEMLATTSMQYDGMGRLTRTDHAVGLVETFTYDQLGQRIGQSNSVLGTAETGYDIMGRVIRQEAMSTNGIGDVTTFARTWVDGETSGVGAYGAYFTETTHANAMTSSETTDQFGHILSRSDMSGYTFSTVTYDKAGRQTNRVTGLLTANYVWLNSGLVASAAIYDFQGLAWETRTASYSYDANGNKLSEYAFRDNAGAITVMQNATAQYDAMNRVTYWAEAGNASVGASSSQIWYDPNSNIRHSYHVYAQVTATGSSYTSVKDFWFAYDSMNRVVVDQGVLSGAAGNPGTIVVRGVSGTDYEYDAAGRRGVALRTLGASTEQETYFYRADNALETVWISPNTDNPNDEENYGVNRIKSRITYDLAGRQITQTDFLSDGQVYAPGAAVPHNQVAYFRTVTYNSKGQIAFEQTVNSVAGQPNRSDSTYEYTDASGNYYLGQAAKVTSSNYRNGTFQSSTVTTNMYTWNEGPSLLQAQVATTTGGTTQNANSAYEYATGGILQSVSVTGQIPRFITYLTDINGQVIRRDEGAVGTVKPHEVWYRFNGKEMGYSGNNHTIGTNYQWSIDNRTIQPLSNPGPFRFGQSAAREWSDFAQSVTPYTSFDQGSSASGYVVRAGETLASIASALWGDSGLWFKLAQANGLSSPGAALIEGQRLNVPPGVARNSHNASTFKPYDPSETLGDTSASPLAPKPKNGNKCGIVGMILLVAIAVAVTVVTSGAFAAVAASAASGTTFGLGAGITMALGGAATVGGVTASLTTVGMIAAGAIGAAAGSIVSQGVGVATGLQSQFSWKGVAMAALSGGISGGISASGVFASMGTFARGALSAATSSALSQGIGVATGLQDKFDWVGVATAGLSGGVGASVGKALNAGPWTDMSARNIGANLATSAASAIASAAARSLIQGSDFGDNLMAALPDVIGGTIGNLLVGSVQGSGSKGLAEMAGSKDPVAKSNAMAEFKGQGGPDPEAQPGNESEQNVVVTGTPIHAVPDPNLPDPNRPREVTPEQLARWQQEVANKQGLGMRLLQRRELDYRMSQARSDRSRAEITRQMIALDATIAELRVIHAALIRDGIGRIVPYGEGTYQIRGPGANFGTADNAVNAERAATATAKDGLALAFYITGVTRDPWERSGAIRVNPDNTVTYSGLNVGVNVGRNPLTYHVRVNGEWRTRSAEAYNPFGSISIPDRSLGYFHTHPNGPTSQGYSLSHTNHQDFATQNHDFSPTDVEAFGRITRNNVPFFATYLGGSNGSFRMLLPGQHNSRVIQANAFHPPEVSQLY